MPTIQKTDPEKSPTKIQPTHQKIFPLPSQKVEKICHLILVVYHVVYQLVYQLFFRSNFFTKSLKRNL
ncbi:MAG: hypothetical protein MRECE_2c022 [Mycoplasmataceae bacterium CE_OT135]|nr:MAG: hypothetical protein MRECE_2c022 [Mycoplasmataceae bacterium CE_OT135]